MAGWGLRAGRWRPLLGLVCALGALSFLPLAGGAQETTSDELAAAQRALAEQQQLASSLAEQLSATADLPQQIVARSKRIDALLRAQQNALAAGNLTVARAHHERVAEQLRSTGRELRRALAPRDEAQTDKARGARRVARLSAHAQKLLAHAARNGLSVDVKALNAARNRAEQAIQAATNGVPDQGVDRALATYETELERIEDTVIAAALADLDGQGMAQ